MAAACLVALASGASAQVLLDRVVARVNGIAVTLSDVRAALMMGAVVAADNELPLAIEQTVQRQLLLAEVERFPPPEPSAAAIDQEEARIRSRLGASFPGNAAQTGVDERRVRQTARDTLRIRAYLDQRFGVDFQVSDAEARAFYAANATLFARDGIVPSFELVESDVRQRAAAIRRQTTIDQWMTDLRQRADVVLTR
jgi:hypothetical protein